MVKILKSERVRGVLVKFKKFDNGLVGMIADEKGGLFHRVSNKAKGLELANKRFMLFDKLIIKMPNMSDKQFLKEAAKRGLSGRILNF